MAKQKLSSFTANHSMESFRMFLKSLSHRGQLREIGKKFDVRIVSKIFYEDDRRLEWMISTTPNEVMKIRKESKRLAEEASEYAKTCEILRRNLDQQYTRTRNYLLEQFRDAEQESSPEKMDQIKQQLERLDNVHPKELERVSAEPAAKEEQLRQKHLELDGEFKQAQQKTMRGMWIEADDTSLGSDQLTVNIVSYSGLVEFIDDRDTALFQIAKFILGESAASGSTEQQSPTELIPEDCSQVYNMSEYPLTEHIMPGVKKDFRECWSKWGDDKKENFEKTLNLIKEGHSLVRIGRKLSVSESTISKRLNGSDRCSPRLTMEEVRSLLSSY